MNLKSSVNTFLSNNGRCYKKFTSSLGVPYLDLDSLIGVGGKMYAIKIFYLLFRSLENKTKGCTNNKALHYSITHKIWLKITLKTLGVRIKIWDCKYQEPQLQGSTLPSDSSFLLPELLLQYQLVQAGS